MSVYNRFILPRIIKKTCSTKPISKQREKIVPLAKGWVLEIGVGNGLNMPFYDKTKVTHVFGLDISPELMEGAVHRAKETGMDFEPLLLDAAAIPLDANVVDTVLVTYAMCSIDALQSALAEMHRVLKPSGKLVFCEHGLAPDPKVRRMQKRITPLWKRISGGCRLDRNIPKEIENAGFQLSSLEQMYIPGTWRIAGFDSWGTASPN